MDVFNFSQLQHLPSLSKKSGELYTHQADIGALLNLKNVAIYHQILEPGRKSSTPHFHTEKEEIVFILEGEATVHFGDEIKILKTGDFFAFPVAEEKNHFLENRTISLVKMLLIMTKGSPNDAVFLSDLTRHH